MSRNPVTALFRSGVALLLCAGLGQILAADEVAVSPEPPVAPGHWLEPYVAADGGIDVAAALHGSWDQPHPEQDNLAVAQALAIGPDYLPLQAPRSREVLAAVGLADIAARGPFLAPPAPADEQQIRAAVAVPWDATADWTRARSWSQANRAVITRYLAAEADRFLIPYVAGPVCEQPVPSLMHTRRLGQALLLLGRERLQAGDAVGAVRIAARLRHDGCLMTRGRTVIEAMVGIVLIRLGCDAMLEIIRSPEAPEEAQQPWRGQPWWPADMDRMMDRCERLGALADPRTTFLAEAEQTLLWKALSPQMDLRAYRRCINDAFDEAVAVWRLQDLKEMEARDRLLQQRMLAWRSQTQLHGGVEDIGTILQAMKTPRDLGIRCARIMLTMSIPNLAESRLMMTETIARLRLVDLALAIHRYRNQHHQWPMDLAVLPPAEVPDDPFNRRPLHYRCRGPAWIVWSVGRDGVDDGGDPRTDIIIEHEGPQIAPGAGNF